MQIFAVTNSLECVAMAAEVVQKKGDLTALCLYRIADKEFRTYRKVARYDFSMLSDTLETNVDPR